MNITKKKIVECQKYAWKLKKGWLHNQCFEGL